MNTKQTSKEAFNSITIESKKSMWSKIVKTLKKYRAGLTADEISEKLGIDHVVVNRRMSELREADIVIDTPVTRKTRSGRSAIVRCLSKKAA